VSSSLDGLEPWLRPYAEYLTGLAGPRAVVSSVRRTRAEQARLYRRYLAGQSRFPAAPPGRSLHELGRAWDLVAPPEWLLYLGRVWQSWGGRWGGERDPIHFEA
jgi:hypothetical protein